MLSFDSLRAPQSKCVPLSASLTVKSMLDRTKYSGESMPFSEQECLNSQTSKLHNSNITDILETHKNEHTSLLFNLEQKHSYLDQHTCQCFLSLLFLRVFLHHKASITTLSASRGTDLGQKSNSGWCTCSSDQFPTFSKASFQISSNATPLHYTMTQYSISNNNIQKCLRITL